MGFFGQAMAKLSDLIPATASVLGVPEKTVAIYARHLREARLITTGGRGPGGAEMKPRDCVNLLIAILGAEYAKDAAKIIKKYRPIVAGMDSRKWRIPNMPLPALTQLPEYHQFGNALEALIKAAIDGSLEQALETARERLTELQITFPPTVSVSIRGPVPVARISIWAAEWSEEVTYSEPNPWLKTNKPPKEAVKNWEKKIERRGPMGDLEQARLVSTQTILALGQLLRH